jgi:hypothetical protein
LRALGHRLDLAALAALAAITSGFVACDSAEVTTDSAPATYLIAHGTWVIDETDPSFDDARNPRRLVLQTTDEPGTSSRFSFYAAADGRDPIATDCRYQYNRSQPDSHRFPATKEAVWVIFDLEAGSPAACEPFAKVAFAPAQDGGLHLRYGTLDYAEIVGPALSAPESPDLWWSRYRAVRGERGVPAFPYEIANGERVADPTSETTNTDPRNPSRLTLSTPAEAGTESRFVFYKHAAPAEIWADCNFQVRYTMPDPSAFPGDKLALWDAFELTGTNSGVCAAFERVVMFWTDGGRVMHLRYGTEPFEALLSQSLVDNSASWWSRYCEPGQASCTSR